MTQYRLAAAAAFGVAGRVLLMIAGMNVIVHPALATIMKWRNMQLLDSSVGSAGPIGNQILLSYASVVLSIGLAPQLRGRESRLRGQVTHAVPEPSDWPMARYATRGLPPAREGTPRPVA